MVSGFCYRGVDERLNSLTVTGSRPPTTKPPRIPSDTLDRVHRRSDTTHPTFSLFYVGLEVVKIDDSVVSDEGYEGRRNSVRLD